MEIKRYTRVVFEQKDQIKVLEERIRDKDKVYLDLCTEYKVRPG